MKWSCCAALVLLMSLAAGAVQAQGTDTDYIVGGEPATEGSWPWQVRLFASAGDIAGYCGGSLIADSWVLTAGHCVKKKNGQLRKSIEIGYGSVYRSKLVRVATDKVIPHPKYNNVTLLNDLALLHLAKPVTPSRWVGISSPSAETSLLEAGSEVTVTGWGARWDFKVLDAKTAEGLQDKLLLQDILDENEINFPERMHQVNINVVDAAACESSYSAAGSQFLPDTMLCAGVGQGGKDSCYGDSGGPLVIAAQDGQGYVQIGIVSWGRQCGHPEFPGVYTRISSYFEWIHSAMGTN
jgi:secreted trypsin-like serine protease